MPECLVVAQTMASGPLQPRYRVEEPMMGRAAPPSLPDTFDNLQLRPVAGQPVSRQMRPRLERLGD